MSRIIYAPFLDYLRIAADAHARVIELLGNPQLPNTPFQNTPQGQATIAVVFSSIALESFILNYAERKLGAGYAEKHIDTMNLHTKWMIVPQLVTGKSIPKDNKGIELLQKLVKARNSIVHLKAINIQPGEWSKQKERMSETERMVLEAGTKCFECIGRLGKALCVHDESDHLAKLLAEFATGPTYRVVYADARDVK